MLANIDPDQIQSLIKTLPPDQKQELLKLVNDLSIARTRENSRVNFLDFVKHVWPAFIAGRHHKTMADAFERVANGELKRLIINMPPRHTKSEFASYLFPAWFLGRYPEKKIIQTAHTAELAVGFGRKVRNLTDNQDYKEVFPEMSLSSDSKAAGRWATSKGGDYFAIGVGGAVTGKGADVLIIDDPHSEQDAAIGAYNPEVYDKVYEWYTSGPRQRLQPGGSIIIVMTRWSVRDLTGQIVKKSAERDGSDEWEVIELPAIMPSGKPLWPEFWPLPQLEALKAELPVSKWQAQYQQNPTSEEGALIKREWWRNWERETPPRCDAIIQSWDTAFLKTQRSDYSACTTWGVFYHPNDDGKNVPNLILLDSFKDKLEFPELKRRAYEHYWEWEPDQMIVEKKASGAPLIFELRAMGIPVTEFTPSRGQDKIARVNAVTDLFASGVVWAPPTRWADELIEECAAFPSGDHDDLVDSMTQALLRFRQGGWIRSEMDDWEEPVYNHRKIEYY
jgi:predicted phage terminase large subunit-like protein